MALINMRKYVNKKYMIKTEGGLGSPFPFPATCKIKLFTTMNKSF